MVAMQNKARKLYDNNRFSNTMVNIQYTVTVNCIATRRVLLHSW